MAHCAGDGVLDLISAPPTPLTAAFCPQLCKSHGTVFGLFSVSCMLCSCIIGMSVGKVSSAPPYSAIFPGGAVGLPASGACVCPGAVAGHPLPCGQGAPHTPEPLPLVLCVAEG